MLTRSTCTTVIGTPRPAEDRDGEERDFAQVRREQEGDELPDVVGDRPPLSNGGDDGREVVVGEHEIGGFAGDLGARPSHRDTDVRAPQGGRIVDAVAGDCDDLALGLQASTSRSFSAGVTRA